MPKVGRPVTKKGTAAAKHRKQSREEYQSLPDSGKRKRVASRDKSAQRAADAKRLANDRPARNAYHKTEGRALKSIPKGTKCSQCGSTRNIQRHVVNGKFKDYRCGKCNTNSIGRGA